MNILYYVLKFCTTWACFYTINNIEVILPQSMNEKEWLESLLFCFLLTQFLDLVSELINVTFENCLDPGSIRSVRLVMCGAPNIMVFLLIIYIFFKGFWVNSGLPDLV